MQIGVSIPFRYQADAARPLEETLALAELAEQAGFDFLSMGHHVFTPDYPSASPLTTLAAIAARTERIRIASIIFLLPLHHPVAVAEQVATLDLLSGGRAIFGVGVGYRPYEFEGFGVDHKRRGARTTESLTAIRQAWTTGRWDYQGEEFQIPDLPAVPQPKQQPHPPIWVGGTSAPALKRAAALGDGWVTTNMQTIGPIAKMADSYRELCTASGKRPFVCISRDFWAAASREDMLRDWYGDTLARHLGFHRMGMSKAEDDAVLERVDRGEDVQPEEFINERVIGGTPKDCVAQIQTWKQNAGCDALLLLLNKKASFAQLCQTIERSGNEILPAFRTG